MWRGRRRSRHRRRSTSIPAMKVRSDRVLRSLSTLSLASETSARAGSLSGGDLITLTVRSSRWCHCSQRRHRTLPAFALAD